MMNKVVFDNIVFNLQKFGGISNYWHQLLVRLVNDPDFESYFIENENQNLFATFQNTPREKIISVNGKLPISISRFVNPKLNFIKSKFIFHSSYNRYSTNKNALNVSTIHDLIHFKYQNGARKLIHNTQKRLALMNSAAIITISESTKRDLLNYFPQVSADNIHVVYNGVSDEFYKIDQKYHRYELDEELINQSYILWVSSRERYKNFSFAVDLLNKLPDFKFYIVGGKLSNDEVLKMNRLIPGRWKLFTAISLKTLNELYNHAYVLLYPS
ncbi:MAG: glycosyltransferase, partial [Candidatus Pelagibacter sp.]|nr:glycosyltransferase [Candidatus Pelagibacter sp.]